MTQASSLIRYAPQTSYKTTERSCCDTEINVPYSVDRPPCHVRIKQMIACGAMLAAGITSITMGAKIISDWTETSPMAYSLAIPSCIVLAVAGAGLAICGGLSAMVVLICPRDYGNKAYCPCMPCVSAPCDTCHGED